MFSASETDVRINKTRHMQDTRSEFDDLKKMNAELMEASKLLVRKDLELSRANDRLRELNRTKSEFISVAAHQLRTPLSAIRWVFNLLLEEERGNLTENQVALLRRGYESNQRMVDLVNGLLTVSRIESGKFKYQFEAMRIEDVIRQSLVEFEGQSKDRQVAIVFRKPKEPAPEVLIDKEKMRDVLQNLLSNAMKYTRPGGSVTINVSQKNPAEVEIAVKDTGIGIPSDQQKRIFERFFRAQNAVRLEPDGSGLGLYIVHKIVRKHGGRVWFESVEGEGTTFLIALPTAKRNQ